MCGIAAIYCRSKNINKVETIRKMTDYMSYRGPDASGYLESNDIGLGHRRLSIIDRSEISNQPMTDISGKYHIVFNGEIYNYKELKKKLGINFKTESDTEVILELYKKYGDECVNYLNGMFAFIIWDVKLQRIFMARDHMGVKPLYYYFDQNILIVASEIRSILSSDLVPLELNLDSISDYFFNQAESTVETSIKKIFQILPGQKAIFKDGTLKIDFYWKMSDLNLSSRKHSYELATKNVNKLLYESVERQMIADVPVGAFLSGGIDSSVLVSLMSDVSNKPVETFSITFDESAFDESKYALNVAQMYKTNHHDIRLKSDELLNEIPYILKGLDRLNSDGANIYMVSKATSNSGLKVALSGIGADELFCGYDSFRKWKRLSGMNFFWKNSQILHSPINYLANKLASSKLNYKVDELFKLPSFEIQDVYPIFRNVLSPRELSDLSSLPLKRNTLNLLNYQKGGISKFPVLSQYSIAELSEYTTNVVLNCTDQMSMKHSLEVRVPFLDHVLVEYVLGLPDKFKIKKGVNKILLLDAMKNRIPIENIFRPKMGFTLPYEVWLRGPLKEFATSRILSLSSRDFMKESAVVGYWNHFNSGNPKYTWTRVWSLIVLEEWLQNVLNIKN